MPYRDDDYEDLDPREFPEARSDDHDIAVERCPNCSRWIYEDAEQCSECGYYLTDEEESGPHRPWWVIIAAVLLLLFILYYWI